ncbi:hypothetical protein [Crucivirus-407]|nr:hypothetical protein [Crucivirus-406]QMW68871.1 hypothetical protein [Crucivirus-407]
MFMCAYPRNDSHTWRRYTQGYLGVLPWVDLLPARVRPPAVPAKTPLVWSRWVGEGHPVRKTANVYKTTDRTKRHRVKDNTAPVVLVQGYRRRIPKRTQARVIPALYYRH